jgi:hypothetical protein
VSDTIHFVAEAHARSTALTEFFLALSGWQLLYSLTSSPSLVPCWNRILQCHSKLRQKTSIFVQICFVELRRHNSRKSSAFPVEIVTSYDKNAPSDHIG